MPAVFRYDLLLFLKESAGGVRYLYFVEFDTLDAEVPVLHRFSADAHLFRSALLGGLYRVETRRMRLANASCDAEYDIDDSYFTMLLELKSIKYRNTETLPRFDPDAYYTFEELRDLCEYREPRGLRLANAALRTAAYLPALLLPPALYILLLCLLLPAASGVGAPLFAVLALPAMVFLLALSYQWTQLFLLRRERLRYGMLRQFTLRHGGARQALTMSDATKHAFFRFFIASLGALAVGLVLFILF